MLSLATLNGRVTVDYNCGWEFAYGTPGTGIESLSPLEWKAIHIPHDWSVDLGYNQEDSACSTGFSHGGIGWYRKYFLHEGGTHDKSIWIEFDGIYNNSTCWINGHKLGFRPNGYSSFFYALTPYLKEGANEIVVHVDRTNYADSRWYTGSGIYRDVRLVQTSSTHIPQWGVQVTTPEASKESASVKIVTSVNPGIRNDSSITVKATIFDADMNAVATERRELALDNNTQFVSKFVLANPDLWMLDNPALYTVEVELLSDNESLDLVQETFGIRSIDYTADKGFFLNGENIKIKGVNLHHDAGSLGAAVPRDIWFSRVKQLKELGCNAIRLSHNPHSPHLLDACDELGILVIAEAFDEWDVPKDKSVVFLSDNSAPPEISHAYPEYFNEWAERDLKDLIRRDFNHPSVIMWSIGNEIEWTYRYYPNSSSYNVPDLSDDYYNSTPMYDPEPILERMEKLLEGKPDRLLEIAQQLSAWTKETDSTRFVTCGSVHPSVAYATGYADTVDVLGFNYRAAEYDAAHAYYPDRKVIGSENWGTWKEWQDVNSRDFVGGIFIWTGFAYLGEAGPWPRKGLNISLFDYTGTKTARGHLYEALWKDEPKIFMETVPLEDSESSWSETGGWTFTEREYEIPKMAWLRPWEWYNMNRHWNYEDGEEILIQAYTNCTSAELFLNGKSMGTRSAKDFEDGALRWSVPYSKGTLEVVGLSADKKEASYAIKTTGAPASLKLTTERTRLTANGKDVLQVFVQLLDKHGNPVTNREQEIRFKHTGPVDRIAVDNGSEYNVRSHLDDSVESYEGRAYAVYRATKEAGPAKIEVIAAGLISDPIHVEVMSSN